MPVFYSQYADLIVCMLSCALLFAGFNASGIGGEKTLARPLASWRWLGVALVVLAVREWQAIIGVSKPEFISFFPFAAILHTGAALCILMAAHIESGSRNPVERLINVVLGLVCLVFLAVLAEPYLFYRQYLQENRSLIGTGIFFVSKSAPFITSLALLYYTVRKGTGIPQRRPSGQIVTVLVLVATHCFLVAVSHPPGIPSPVVSGTVSFNFLNTSLFLLRLGTALAMGLVMWNMHSRALGVIRQIRWWPVALLFLFLGFAGVHVLASAGNHSRIVRQNLINSAVNAAAAIRPAELRKAARTPGAANDPEVAAGIFGPVRRTSFFQGYSNLRYTIDAIAFPDEKGGRPSVVADIASNPADGRWNPADRDLVEKILAAGEPAVFPPPPGRLTPTIITAPIYDDNGDSGGQPVGAAVMSVSGVDLARETFRYKQGILTFIPLAFLIFLVMFSGLQNAWLASHSSSRSEAIRLGALGNDLTGVFITRRGVVIDCNERLLNMMKVKRADFLGNAADDAFDIVDPGALKHWQTLVASGDLADGASFETTARRPDGSLVNLLVFGRALAGAEGEPDHFIWESVDITRQKDMENQLRQSRDLLQLTINSLPLGVFLKDGDGAYRMVNKAFGDMLGLTPGAGVVGKRTADFFPAAGELDRVQDGVALGSKGRTIVYEDSFRIGDEIRHVEVYKTAVGSDANPMIVGCLHDFTTRKEAEDRTRGERHFLVQLINALPLSMCFTDHDRIVRICDTDFAREAGAGDPAELVGRLYEDVAPYGPIYLNEDDKALNAGSAQDVDFELEKDGRRRNFIVRRIAMQDENGHVLGLLKAFWDTTDLVAANHAAKKAERAKAAFLSNMSHELRTPMNGIVGMADLIIDHESTEPLQRLYAETVIKSAKTLQMVMDEVMDVATLDDATQKIRLAVAPFPLLALTEEAAQIVSCITEAWGAGVFLKYDFSLNHIYLGDARHLRQIMVQILTHCSRITSDKRVGLEVADAGGGRIAIRVSFNKASELTADDIEAMFKRPEERAKTESQLNIGMFDDRIGLPLAWRLVDAMKGELHITSSGERVTCETVLPLATDRKGDARIGAISTPPGLRGGRVLVATSSADSLNAARSCLEYAGCRVTCASSREEALKKLEALLEKREGGGPLPALFFDAGLVEESKLDSFLRDLSGSAPGHDVAVVLLIGSRQVQNMGDLPDNVRSLVLPPVCPTDLWYKLDSLMQPQAVRGPSSSRVIRRSSDRLTRQVRIPAKVLVAEDNTVNQMVVMGLLKRIGCEASLAKNGREALEMIEGGGVYDIILMDCMMPVMDGYEATTRIRKFEKGDSSGGRRNTIIALTANNVAGDRERCLAAGMDAYMTKPVTLDLLRDAIGRNRPDLVTYVDGIS